MSFPRAVYAETLLIDHEGQHLTRPQFMNRIIEPLLTCVQKKLEGEPETPHYLLRLTVFPMTQEEFDRIKAQTDEPDPA